jgi:hypothetical protein
MSYTITNTSAAVRLINSRGLIYRNWRTAQGLDAVSESPWNEGGVNSTSVCVCVCVCVCAGVSNEAEFLFIFLATPLTLKHSRLLIQIIYHHYLNSYPQRQIKTLQNEADSHAVGFDRRKSLSTATQSGFRTFRRALEMTLRLIQTPLLYSVSHKFKAIKEFIIIIVI